jgi:hypothetical protein
MPIAKRKIVEVGLGRARGIDRIGGFALVPEVTTEPCASPMRSAPGGVAAPSIHAEISSSSLLRTSGAGRRNA